MNEERTGLLLRQTSHGGDRKNFELASST